MTPNPASRYRIVEVPGRVPSERYALLNEHGHPILNGTAWQCTKQKKALELHGYGDAAAEKKAGAGA